MAGVQAGTIAALKRRDTHEDVLAMLGRLRCPLTGAALGLWVYFWGTCHWSVAGTVTLAWDPSPDERVVGYAIYYGTSSGVHPVRIEVGNVTNAVIEGLQPGVTYYFVATAFTADGLESDPSNEVSYMMEESLPPANAPPVVSAGADQTIRLPASATLTGQASDDGLPTDPGVLTLRWEIVSAPGPVRWLSLQGSAAEVGFFEPGLYVFRLVAWDGELTSWDEVRVQVELSASGNRPPRVSAGADQIVDWGDTVTLWGSVRDDGLPVNPGRVVAQWEVINGPGLVNFLAPQSLQTAVTFSQSGLYTLRLVASDGEFTIWDDVTITVLPPPPIDQFAVVWEAETGAQLIGVQVLQTGRPDSPTNAAGYVQASAFGGGTIQWELLIPESGIYVVWLRGYSSDGAGAGFSLALDNGSDIAARVTPTQSGAWEWLPILLNPGSGSPAPPGGGVPNLTLEMSAGNHLLRLRLPDSRLLVDKLLISRSGTAFRPVAPGMAPSNDPVFLAARRAPDRMQLVWRSVPGGVYRVWFKDRWGDPQWQIGSPDLMASGDQIVWRDTSAVEKPQRFYRLQRLY
ncbi:MAG: fibronectin type III domain-containing protein [Verrucomicrobiota bacterium]|nr:fibronectin type III domain-containing protein [Limisphaera sp.]MDW8382763.1 fibronectin type III domain-containing protein [Verrucomicrobiota bacterium]